MAKSMPLPFRLAALSYMKADENSGTSALSHRQRCTTRSEMWTLRMCRSFPRSMMSNSWKPIVFHVPSISAFRVLAVFSDKLARYRCVEHFQRTPLQHASPALYRFS